MLFWGIINNGKNDWECIYNLKKIEKNPIKVTKKKLAK